MRLLAIGYPLPDPSIDNYNVLTAPSYFDYEAVFVDPRSITESVAQLLAGTAEFTSHDGRPVVNSAGSASAASAAEQLRRRADETQRLLEAGGVVVVAGRPNATQVGVIGVVGCDRYSWLPAPPGLSWGPPYLRAAEGTTIRVVADQHPLGDAMREFRHGSAYRALLDNRQAAVRQSGRVLATGGAGVPIAMEFPVLGGRIIFLPAFREDYTVRNELASSLVDACRRLVGAVEVADAPYWTRSAAVPGLEQVEADVEAATETADAAQARLAAARERQRELAGFRDLLWREGPPHEEAARNAFRALGFEVSGGADAPLEVVSEGRRAFVEVAGSREQLVEWPYVHLQRRLEAHLLAGGEQLKGIVVVNGHRISEPVYREPEFTDALRIACENYRYTLLTTDTLFAITQRALGGADEAALRGYRRRIMGAAGLVTRDAALGDVETSKESGPIF